MLVSAQRGAGTSLLCLMRWSGVFSLACWSLSLPLSPSFLNCVLSCILPPTPFFFLALLFPPSFIRPAGVLIGLLGIKPAALETWGTFGSKMARGTVATYLLGVLLLALWKPSKQGGRFSLSAIWHILHHPTEQHLCLRCQTSFTSCSPSSCSIDSSRDRERVAFFCAAVAKSISCVMFWSAQQTEVTRLWIACWKWVAANWWPKKRHDTSGCWEKTNRPQHSWNPREWLCFLQLCEWSLVTASLHPCNF